MQICFSLAKFINYILHLKAKKQSASNSIPIKKTKYFLSQGFTLIEVLIALAIIAISLTALLKSISQSILTTQRIQDKTTSHFVATQGITLAQLGLLPLTNGSTQATEMFSQRWYWRIETSQSPIKKVRVLTVTVSKNQAGPFQEALRAFHYEPD